MIVLLKIKMKLPDLFINHLETLKFWFLIMNQMKFNHEKKYMKNDKILQILEIIIIITSLLQYLND